MIGKYWGKRKRKRKERDGEDGHKCHVGKGEREMVGERLMEEEAVERVKFKWTKGQLTNEAPEENGFHVQMVQRRD